MARGKRQTFIKGSAKHTRTEADYMSVILETVSLDDWRDVITNALAMAKAGDTQARAWLAQYLVGKPAYKAPTPLTVVVQQLNGADPVVDKLADPVIDRALYPSLHKDDKWKERLKELVALELAEKVNSCETSFKLGMAGSTSDSGNLE